MLDKAEEKQVVEYSVVEADIAQMRSVYMDLKITDLEDTEQFKQVKEARLVVKGKRCAVENERKALNANAIAWQKEVNGRAKEIFALIEPIETHLQNEENKVIYEQKRIDAEEAERQRKINQKRVDDLLAVEVVLPFIEVATLTDDEFNELLMGKTLRFEEAQKLKAIKEAEQKAEAERLAQQKAEQEAEAKKLAEQNAKLEAEQKAIEDQKKSMRTDMMLAAGFELENDTFYFVGFMDFSIPMSDIMEVPSTMFKNHVLSSKAEAEKQMKESAELAEKERKAEAKDKAEREAKEAEERKKAEAEAKARAGALKPDKQKLTEWIEKWSLPPEHPELKNDESVNLFENIIMDLDAFFQVQHKRIKDL